MQAVRWSADRFEGLCLGLGLGLGSRSTPMTRATIFTNARLPDLARGALTAPTTLTVADGRILGAGLPAPAEARTVDLGGLTLMPGLIDCHFHVVAWSLDLWSNAIAPDSLAALRAARVMEELLAA